MEGASEAHVTVALNVGMTLGNHLCGSPCRGFISDMKLRAEGDNAFFYPDIFVPAPTATAAKATAKVPPC